MPQRLANRTFRTSAGVTRATLRLWALGCLLLGTMGASLFQNGLLNMPNLSTQGLLTVLETDPKAMGYATTALVMQAINCCAAPLFAFLLVEGFENTGNRLWYFLRVLGVAVVSELPYNLAVGGKWIDTQTRNPVFGLVLAMLMLYFFCHFHQKHIVHYAINAFVALAATVWTMMLGIQDGAPLVVLTLVLWLCRRKPLLRTVFGCVVAFACSIFSPFYLLSPMVFILLHLYNGEPGEESIWFKHAAYPVILLVLGLLTDRLL